MDRDKYCVIPTKYIELLTRAQKKKFLEVLGVVTEIRKVLGKEVDPGYYVCKHDEPYSESVRDMIEEGEEAKERVLNVGTGEPSRATAELLEKVMGCQNVNDKSIEDNAPDELGIHQNVLNDFLIDDTPSGEDVLKDFTNNEAMIASIDTSKLFHDFDEFEIGVIESLENDATIKAKREEIQRHVERMEFLNNIGKKDV